MASGSSGLDEPVVAIPTPAPAVPDGGGGGATLALSLVLPLVIAAAFFLLFRGRSKSRGDRVVLFGPMGAGKTALSLQLRFGRMTPTYSSLAKTVSRCDLGGGGANAVTLVDVPGSGRLRSQLLSEAASAAVLACVIDGSRLALQCKEAAGALFDVLSLEAVQRRSPALLVVLSKSEARGAASPESARTLLEAEVQKVRLARTTMADTGGAGTKDIPGFGAAGFSFAHTRLTTQFVSASASTPQLDAVRSFVLKHVG